MDSKIDNDIEKELREIRATRIHRMENEPHRYYEPIGKGEQFINAFASGEYISILLEAANGIGKTMLIANLLANLFWPVQNKYFEGKIFKDWKYPKKGRIVSDPNTITETIIPMLKTVFPKGRYKNDDHFTTTKEGKRFESNWLTDTGWSFTLMTYEQDVKEFESATLGFVWMDEPPPQPIYKANYARLRMGGIAMITETPLSGSQWIYDEFIELSPDKLKKQKKFIVHAEIEDACIEHGENGFIEHEQIETMISQYDDDDMQARAFGKHAHLSGLIFKKFNTSIHVIKPFALPADEWLVVHALDPHPRVKDAGLWVAFGLDNRKIICDELSFDAGDGDTQELAIRIKGINKSYRMSQRLLIDPSAFIVDKHSGESLAGNLQLEGLMYEEGSKARTQAIRLIRDELNYIFQNGIFIKQPGIYIFDTCVQTIWELGHWQWEDWQGKTAAYKTLKEKPLDKNDHFIEDLGRILLSGIKYEPPPIIYRDNRQYKAPELDPYEKLSNQS
jgi:phage terminase large subunit-like protein